MNEDLEMEKNADSLPLIKGDSILKSEVIYRDPKASTYSNCERELQMGFSKRNEKSEILFKKTESEHLISCRDKITSNLKSNQNLINNKRFIDDNWKCGRNLIKKATNVLQNMTVKELKLFISDLSEAVKDVSSQLVSLLQENDNLRQESDARHIAIEQLLKLTVKQTETELQAVRLSVTTSSEEHDEEWD